MSKPLNMHDGTGILATAHGKVLIAYGTTAPADNAVGYAGGALFIDTDSAAVYRNAGSATAADFDPILTGTQGAALTAQSTAITFTAPGTPDYALQDVINTNAYGFAAAEEARTFIAVVSNLQTRLAEVEARLEAAGIVAAN